MGKFFFIGEAAALNFVNTEVVVAGESRDLLENFGDLVRWSVEARLITEMQADLLAVFEDTPKGEAAHASCPRVTGATPHFGASIGGG